MSPVGHGPGNCMLLEDDLQSIGSGVPYRWPHCKSNTCKLNLRPCKISWIGKKSSSEWYCIWNAGPDIALTEIRDSRVRSKQSKFPYFTGGGVWLKGK